MKRFVLLAVAMLTACGGNSHRVDPRLDTDMPRRMIWAWERPEDLRFLEPKEFGVAFLAQTISLENDRAVPKPRRQPLELSPGTYVIAVTRIETLKEMGKGPTLDEKMAGEVASLIKSTCALPDVKGVQVDFDAVSSERAFYRSMMTKLANEIKALDAADANTHHSSLTGHHSLTMTSLASWCTGDAWFNDFPVDEAIPMVFQMGSDEQKIKTYLRNGNDWLEPLCRGSYGLSIDDPIVDGIRRERRIYYFKNSTWSPSDVARMH